jgi:hypothetical protein
VAGTLVIGSLVHNPQSSTNKSSWPNNCNSTNPPARPCCAAWRKLARAVKATLGPAGRNVIIDKKFGSPTITKDGVSVAKESNSSDPYENMGAQLIREVSSKTSDIAGDGTTTATVLAEAIYKEGLRNVTAGANPISLKRGIMKATEAIVAELKKISKPSPTPRKSPRSPPSPPTPTRKSATSSPMPWTRSARTAPSPWKKPRASKPPSKWSKACSSTRATSAPTS